MDINSLLNNVLGDKNVFFQGLNGNTIHFGDIIYDKTTKRRSIKCPKCKTPASEDTKEETRNYIAFTCLKCGNRFFEYDEVAQNISLYVDLTGEESKEFERLIEAVNHDLHVGDINYAYERCRKNKEVYGKTPQIYEWGALTLFLTHDINFWIRHSIDGVIAYLQKSKQLDSSSRTYNKIAASIATRYYQGVMEYLEFTKLEMPAKPIFNKELSSSEKNRLVNEYNEKIEFIRKELFKYLKQVEICYKLYPDTDFIKAALNELYGYNGMAWFTRRFSKFFKRPIDDPTGKIKMLKGYVWDFHNITGNSDHIFAEEGLTPSELAVRLESSLRKADPSFEFPEIRVGELDKVPLSARASMNVFQFATYGIFTIITIFLWLLKWKFMLFVFITCLFFFVYKKDKDGNYPDDLRRLLNKHTGHF